MSKYKKRKRHLEEEEEDNLGQNKFGAVINVHPHSDRRHLEGLLEALEAFTHYYSLINDPLDDKQGDLKQFKTIN